MAYKYDSIDVLKLFSGTLKGFEDDYVPQDADHAVHTASRSYNKLKSHDKWNAWLNKCLKNNNLEDLVRVRYGLQRGMDDLVKKNVRNDLINEMFLRWVSSIEKTAKKIIIKKNPLPVTKDNLRIISEKRKRDEEFDKFLMRSSF